MKTHDAFSLFPVLRQRFHIAAALLALMMLGHPL